jgi:rare lipoprotein A (peptidoglycan hydrolase)
MVIQALLFLGAVCTTPNTQYNQPEVSYPTSSDFDDIYYPAGFLNSCQTVTGKATYYMAGESGLADTWANGQTVNSNDIVAAYWGVPLDVPSQGVVSYITVQYEVNGTIVEQVVRVVDRGPNMIKYPGYFLDLSPTAFQKFAPLAAGVITVTVSPTEGMTPCR